MNSDILKKVLKIRFALRKKSNRAFLGYYRSAFKGSGLSFADFREYTPGDDMRSVSWPLTAKMGKPYIKLFEEDRGQAVFFMIDISASSYFGSKSAKFQAMSQALEILILSAEQNQDRTGLLLFSDQVEHYAPLGKGRSHTLRLVRDIHSFKARSRKTHFKESCSYVSKVLKKKSSLFVFSDFLSDDFEKYIPLLSVRHDAAAVIVQDPLEKELPVLGLADVEDAETGNHITIDTSSSRFRQDYYEKAREEEKEREKKLKKLNMQYFYIKTNEDVWKPLVQFFHRKQQ